jgi:hypothetical protein
MCTVTLTFSVIAVMANVSMPKPADAVTSMKKKIFVLFDNAPQTFPF